MLSTHLLIIAITLGKTCTGWGQLSLLSLSCLPVLRLFRIIHFSIDNMQSPPHFFLLLSILASLVSFSFIVSFLFPFFYFIISSFSFFLQFLLFCSLFSLDRNVGSWTSPIGYDGPVRGVYVTNQWRFILVDFSGTSRLYEAGCMVVWGRLEEDVCLTSFLSIFVRWV